MHEASAAASQVVGSGMAEAVSVVNVNEVESSPLEFVEVKLHVPGVGSNPCPVIVPGPLIFRNVLLCDEIVDDIRSKVKPSTCHSFGVAGPVMGDPGVPKLKTHGVLPVGSFTIVTMSPLWAKVAKSPVARLT